MGLGQVSNTWSCWGFWVNVYTLIRVSSTTTILKRGNAKSNSNISPLLTANLPWPYQYTKREYSSDYILSFNVHLFEIQFEESINFRKTIKRWMPKGENVKIGTSWIKLFYRSIMWRIDIPIASQSHAADLCRKLQLYNGLLFQVIPHHHWG